MLRCKAMIEMTAVMTTVMMMMMMIMMTEGGRCGEVNEAMVEMG